MKLFVCGTTSGNPDDWDQWDEFSLVISETAEQAARLDGRGWSVYEVDMSKARVLVTMSEPNLGEDL